MKSILIKLLASMCSLMLVANLLPGVSVSNWSTAFVAALVMGLVNGIVRPVLGLLTLPITFLTLGLFSFILNAAMFGLAAWLVNGFEVNGFWPSLWGSIGYGIVSTLIIWVLDSLVTPDKRITQ